MEFKLKKINERYFLPLDVSSYMDIFVFIFLIIISSILIFQGNRLFILFLIFGIISLIVYIKDSFFIQLKTNHSFQDNVTIIRELSFCQNNISESLEKEGLFVFEYNERSPLYQYNYKKSNNLECVVILCEEGSIWLNSFKTLRYLGLIRRYNMKQWIKLIKLNTV